MLQIGLFDPLMPYPSGPGHQGTDTSIEAAAEIAPTAGTLRNAAFKILSGRPSTADEVAELMSQSVLAVRPRITELRRTGQIRDSGVRRKNNSGRRAIVWQIVAS